RDAAAPGWAPPAPHRRWRRRALPALESATRRGHLPSARTHRRPRQPPRATETRPATRRALPTPIVETPQTLALADRPLKRGRQSKYAPVRVPARRRAPPGPYRAPSEPHAPVDVSDARASCVRARPAGARGSPEVGGAPSGLGLPQASARPRRREAAPRRPQ